MTNKKIDLHAQHETGLALAVMNSRYDTVRWLFETSDKLFDIDRQKGYMIRYVVEKKDACMLDLLLSHRDSESIHDIIFNLIRQADHERLHIIFGCIWNKQSIDFPMLFTTACMVDSIHTVVEVYNASEGKIDKIQPDPIIFDAVSGNNNPLLAHFLVCIFKQYEITRMIPSVIIKQMTIHRMISLYREGKFELPIQTLDKEAKCIICYDDNSIDLVTICNYGHHYCVGCYIEFFEKRDTCMICSNRSAVVLFKEKIE